MYKRLILAAALAGSICVAPLTLIATPAAALQCSDTAPEGHRRPGGFCDLHQSNDTLAPPLPVPTAQAPTAPTPDLCIGSILPGSFKWLPRGGRVLAAGC